MRTIEPDIELVFAAENLCGETPVWHPGEAALYWVDCDGHELLRWNEATGDVKCWPMPERVGGIAMKQGGGGLVTLASALFDFDFTSGTLVPRIASPHAPNIAMHESGVDPHGNFWVGGINLAIGPENMNPGGASLCRLAGERLVAELGGISCANGLAFSPDGRFLYFSDSPTRRCDRYPLSASGNLGPRETFFELGDGEGFVDGATVDAEGGYWATLVSVGKLRRYLPDGTPDLEVILPFNNPTKVAFGGADMRRLFITSMSESMGGTNPLALDGGLFAFAPGVAGLPEPMLKQ
jgi:L-arabinonolactonase